MMVRRARHSLSCANRKNAAFPSDIHLADCHQHHSRRDRLPPDRFPHVRAFALRLRPPPKLTRVSLFRYQAFRHADTLHRFQMPLLGGLASKWVDSE